MLVDNSMFNFYTENSFAIEFRVRGDSSLWTQKSVFSRMEYIELEYNVHGIK